MNKIRTIAICGPGRVGKDTVSLWLKANTILRYDRSTSEAAARLCFEAFREKYGYATADEAFADRHNHRREWAECIWRYNQPHGITLYTDMLQTTDILNGIRRAPELNALRMRGLIDLTLWVQRDVPTDPSLEMTEDDADIIIPNNQTIADLETRLQRLALAFNILCT